MKILAVPTLLLAIATLGSAAPSASTWMPAVVSNASAIAEGNGFTVSATVQLSQPKACFDVRIAYVRRPLHDAHFLVQQLRNEKICTEVITPYVAVTHVTTSTVPKSVKLFALTPRHHLVHMTVPITHL